MMLPHDWNSLVLSDHKLYIKEQKKTMEFARMYCGDILFETFGAMEMSRKGDRFTRRMIDRSSVLTRALLGCTWSDIRCFRNFSSLQSSTLTYYPTWDPSSMTLV